MKYILTATSIIFWLMGSLSATAGSTFPVGSYSCAGKSAAGDKAFKGTLVVTASAAKPKLFQTVFTYNNGTVNVGTLRASKVANIYIQRWHSVSGHKKSGLSQLTRTPDGGISLQYVLIEHSTGQFTSGSGTCKPVTQ